MKYAGSGGVEERVPRARGTNRVGVAILIAVCTFALSARGLAEEPGLERHVIYLKNAEAAELAETLNALISGEPGTPHRLRIFADVRRNALVIESTPEDFEALRDVIGQLDTRRPQVLMESLILELRSDAERALESEPLVEAMRAAAPLTGTILGSSVQLRSWRPGGPIELPPLEAAALLGGTDEGLRIVLAPSVLTADNEEAQIVLGTQDPLWTARLTPQIREENGGAIRLTVDNDEEPFRGGPWVLREGQALLLGGPIRTLGTSLLPPPFGSRKKAQLFLIVTPRIVRDPEDLERLEPPSSRSTASTLASRSLLDGSMREGAE